ncbi:GPI mannosyltransferase 1 [Vanrija albida]|uniref:GPI mannosyltransferase 1 n=1 Tax=Vanrija albida TaxID=181172 RepID=A0ABR3PXC8_9TREE
MRRPSTRALLLVSGGIQLALLAYAAYVDAHPERFGGLAYTDVDWRVVADGLAITASPSPSQLAAGPLAPYAPFPIGSPYHRATFRYTPLLVLVLAPALIAPLAGRLVLVALTLALPPVLLGTGADFWKTHLLWTLNPVVLNITTRGSPEALPCLLTALLVAALRKAGLGTPPVDKGRAGDKGSAAPEPSAAAADAAAALLAIAASYKIYPAIYVASIWAALAARYGWFGARVWRFGLVAAATALVLNGALYAVWGDDFLHHTYLYHLSRLDHRHNFSAYFLPIYLNLTSPAPAAGLLAALRHPLASFLPQVSLVLGAGLALTPAVGLEAAMFFQTTLFIVFNKVCTSQYFLWPLPLVPLVAFPGLRWRTLALCLAAWVGAQALWLATAYRLEFLGEPVYLPLWAAGLLLFAVSIAGLGALLDGAVAPAPAPTPAQLSK